MAWRIFDRSKKEKCGPDELWVKGKGKKVKRFDELGERAKARKADIGFPVNSPDGKSEIFGVFARDRC